MADLNALPLAELYRHLAGAGDLVRRLLELARDEDLGPGDASAAGGAGVDITSEVCIRRGQQAEAQLVVRQEGTLAGLAALPDVASVLGSSVDLTMHASDGDSVEAGQVAAVLRGEKRDMLTLERLALNLVGRLSGIATLTARYVRAAGSGSKAARIYDTRKTTPGMRALEKYAVRCGGGFCHRMGLHDAVLIKDNHLAGVALEEQAAFVADAAARARAARPDLLFVEVEVDSLDQMRRLMDLEPGTIDIVLLDNMGPAELRQAASLRDKHRPDLLLEASGGITLETIGEIAQTGVDRVSVGALTHSAVALDVALDIEGEGPQREGSGA